MARGLKKGQTTEITEGTLVTIADVETTPEGLVRRWCAELELAHQEEQDWRKEAEEIEKTYEAEEARASSFDILWSNTEILAASVYNSTPEPDVRRRFRDADPVGKAVSKVLERAISYEIDNYDFDHEIELAVLDLLLPGRAIVRVKYEPKFVQVNPGTGEVLPAPPAGSFQEPADAESTFADPPIGTAAPQAPVPQPYEKIADQKAECCYVRWSDFRRGPGKTWREVTWIAFRHEFTYQMARETFGQEIAKALTYDTAEGTDRVTAEKSVKNLFKVCVVWEIWDREQRRVLFIAPTFSKQPCRVDEDPLKLKDFWPMPRPAYAVRSTRGLVPIPLYRLYREQAEELNRISARIATTVNALRLRGAYSAALSELGTLIEAEDTDMVPVQNAAAVAESGGLEKNIWMMPVGELIRVLNGLYEAREQQKQTIYEIMGLGDILRGASDPNETAKAQQIKSTWGSIRVRRLQREVQRLARDVVRLKAEVISAQFTPQHLAAMTNVQLPTAAQKQQAQQAAAQAQQQQQPPPPEVEAALESPSWDEVIGVMRSDELRSYRVDVETDSTIAETIDRDMKGLAEVAQGVAQALQSVAQGVPIETAKEFALALVRRARLGSAVEDAIEKIPQQEEQMQQFAQQIMQMIQQQSATQAQSIVAAKENEANLANYDAEIRGTLEQVGQVVATTQQQTSEAANATVQTAQANHRLLQQIAQVVRASIEQGNAAQVQMQQSQEAMQQALTQTAAQLQGVAQMIQQASATMAEVVEQMKRPKKVSMKLPSGRTAEATAE